MKKIVLLFSLMASTVFTAEKDPRCFELRVYYAAPGKLDDLHARFRNHTLKIFQNHGIANIGYWVPMENSEANGKLVAKVESTFLAATDYSPEVKPGRGAAQRVFELRTYTAAEGKLDALNARFRDHTVGLFARHGMTQFGYWTPTDKKQGSDNTLIYILSHQSKEAAAKSFDAFRANPEWIKVKAESEKDGSLTIKDGVKSVFMAPTDYSPTK